jgi:cation:H+ antiporter
VLLILGLTSVVAPHGLAVGGEMLRWDLPFLALVAIACYPVFRSGRRISRAEAACFVAAYLVYLASLLVLRSGLA